DAGCGYWSKCD
ncbi:SRP54-type, GTPase domain protein, partial [Vibrio parahaemolyticus VPTS-2010_2]